MTANINEADAATIAKVLKGVGISHAQNIVDSRELRGKFYSAVELTPVKGIGQPTIMRNLERDMIR